MKYFLPFIMALTILTGIVVALTPYAFDYFFPVKENVIREADPEAAADALNIWFLSPSADFRDVHAVRKRSKVKSTSWFYFKVKRAAVENFIGAKKLEQLDLNEDILNTTFFATSPPRAWWKPKSLTRSSYFKGIDQGRYLALIYNAETEEGFLVTTISAKIEDKKK